MLLAFPTIFIDANGHHEYREGSLFTLPAELKDPFRLQKYISIQGSGWQTTEFGYLAYIREDKQGNKYILPGLYLTDGIAPIRKIKGYQPIFNKQQVESYLLQHLSWEEKIRQKSEAELTALVHDLRHLSTSIYHSALIAENANLQNDKKGSIEGIKTVIASQTMLKARIDYLDFANSVDRFEDNEIIPIYSRVDKVIRCFRASATHNNIEITLTGNSYRQAVGPNILDIVPYTLIENSIKYAPKNTNVMVNVYDTEHNTNVEVTSIGPLIDNNETELIFKQGYRGVNAAKLKTTGTGLGLAVANRVIEVFKGEISVKQYDDVLEYNSLQYRKLTFYFSIPSSGQDEGRKRRHQGSQLRKQDRNRNILTAAPTKN